MNQNNYAFSSHFVFFYLICLSFFLFYVCFSVFPSYLIFLATSFSIFIFYNWFGSTLLLSFFLFSFSFRACFYIISVFPSRLFYVSSNMTSICLSFFPSYFIFLSTNITKSVSKYVCPSSSVGFSFHPEPNITIKSNLIWFCSGLIFYRRVYFTKTHLKLLNVISLVKLIKWSKWEYF
jgi:hypothetical protein